MENASTSHDQQNWGTRRRKQRRRNYFFIIGKMEECVYSRNRKMFYKTLSLEEKRRRGRKIPREWLQHPSRSAWRKLYESGNDAALITLTGLDHVTFDELNIKFKLIFDSHTPHAVNGTIEILAHCAGSRGRPCLIQPHDCLGLCAVSRSP
jgi:hypothetical protein